MLKERQRELEERFASDYKKMQDLHTRAGADPDAETRKLIDAAQDDLDKTNTELRDVMAQIARDDQNEATLREIEKRRQEAGDPRGGVGDGSGPEVRKIIRDADELRMVEALAIQKELRNLLGMNPAMKPEKVFGYEGRSLKEVTGYETRDLGVTDGGGAVGLTATGTATVGTTFVGDLISDIRDLSAWRRYARTINTPRGEDMTMPRNTGHITAYWVAEGNTITDSDMAFDTVTLNAHKMAALSYLSPELIQDDAMAPDLVSQLRVDFAEGLAQLGNVAFVGGSGTGQPTGCISTATPTVTAASNTAITAQEFFDVMFDSGLESVRRNGMYIMSPEAERLARLLVDGNGRYIFNVDEMRGGPGATIWGRPYSTDTGMPTLAASARPVAYGLWNRAYAVRDVLSMAVTMSEHFKFDTDMIGFKITARTDGKVLQPKAYSVMELAA